MRPRTSNFRPRSSTSRSRTKYSYDATSSGGGEPANEWAMVERPRRVIESAKGLETGRTYYRFEGPYYRFNLSTQDAQTPGPVRIRQVRVIGADFNGPPAGGGAGYTNLEYVVRPNQVGPADIEGPEGKTTYSASGTGNSSLTIRHDGPDGSRIDETYLTLNARGNLLNSQAYDGPTGMLIDDIQSEADSFGRITQITDMFTGRSTSYHYFPGNWLGPDSMSDPDGLLTSFTRYNALGLVLEAHSPSLGLVNAYRYDAAGNVIATERVDLLGGALVTTAAQYDVLGRLKVTQDEAGGRTYIGYGSGGSYTATYADGSTYTENHHLDGSLAGISGTSTHLVSYEYDVDPTLGAWSEASMNGGANWQRQYYNAAGQVWRIDRSGTDRQVRIEYDGRGRPWRQTDLDGTVRVFHYNGLGQLESVLLDADADPTLVPTYTPSQGDRLTSYVQTVASRGGRSVFQSSTILHGDGSDPDVILTDQVTPDGLEAWSWRGAAFQGYSRFDYGSAPGSGVSRSTLANGTSIVDFFQSGQLVGRQRQGLGASAIAGQAWGYDGLGRNDALADAFGISRLAVRGNGSVSGVSLPDGRTTAVGAYNPASYQPTQITRPDGGLTNLPINGQGQGTSQNGAGTLWANFGYDGNTGQLTSLSTASGTTTWQYFEATGLPQFKFYPGDAVADIEYVFNDKLQLQNLLRPGSAAHYTYHANGELLSVSYNQGELLYEVTGRDAQGRVRALSYTSGGVSRTVGYHYDALGRVDSETLPHLGLGYRTAWDFWEESENPAHSSTGGLQGLSVRDGQDQVLVQAEYDYWAMSKRLESVKFGQQEVRYTYWPGTERVEWAIYPNGTKSHFVYEGGTGRLASVTTTNASDQVIYAVNYDFYLNDQRKEAQVTRALPAGASGPSSFTWKYGYDFANGDQLTSATAYLGTQAIAGRSFSYSFDEAGNRMGNGYVANEANQYVLIPGIESPLVYDGRGNLTNDYRFVYAYDLQDRLIEASNSSVKVTFGYDPDGRRTWKQSYIWNASLNEGTGGWEPQQHLRFAYDGWNLLAEFAVQADGSNQLLRSYTWGVDLGGGVGGLLALTHHNPQTGVPELYYPFYDGNGNVMGLTDVSGSVAASYEYSPFGQLLSSQGPAADLLPLLWATKYRDLETGLSYFGYRYYSPELGRFMTRDPIEEAGGLNVYAYAQNDPINGFDALGLAARTGVHIEQESFEAEHIYLGRIRDVVVPRSLSLGFDSFAEPAVGDRIGPFIDRNGNLVPKARIISVVDTRCYWYPGRLYYYTLEPELGMSAAAVAAECLQWADVRVTGSLEVQWSAENPTWDDVHVWSQTLVRFKDEIHRQIEANASFTMNMFLGEAVGAVAGGAWSMFKQWGQVRSELGGVGPTQARWFRKDGNFSCLQIAPVKARNAAVSRVAGRMPRNYRWAGNVMPLPADMQRRWGVVGIRFKATGYPDFSPVARMSLPVKGLTGDRYMDEILANAAAREVIPGWEKPLNYTWHHVEDSNIMQLVPTPIHQHVGHTGSAAQINAGVLIP